MMVKTESQGWNRFRVGRAVSSDAALFRRFNLYPQRALKVGKTSVLPTRTSVPSSLGLSLKTRLGQNPINTKFRRNPWKKKKDLDGRKLKNVEARARGCE